MNELKLAAEAFLEGSDGCQVNIDKKEVKCSQIFKWYREDFGKNDKDVRYYFISVQRCRGLVDMM